MGTVKLGGRTLTVRPATLGFLKKQILPAQRRVAEARSEEETIDAAADMILAYVGHNDGVTIDFVLDHTPANPRKLIESCIAASGQEQADEGEGKAASP